MATPDEGWKITSALAAITDEAALDYLKQYFGLGEWAGREYTGAHFDSFVGPGPGRLTAEDIIAVACMSVHVPARAALEILGSESGEISRLLGLIPNSALEDVPFEAHDTWFGEGSAALLLWRLLRTHQDVDATTASKIMARKRLGLIPIYDSVVGRLTGFPTAKGTWRAWHLAFSTDAEFTERLRSLREAAGLEHVTLLRILDVVLWMHGTQGIEGPERVDDSESA